MLTERTAQHVSTFSFRTCSFSIWLQLFSNFVCVPNFFKLKFLNDSIEQYLSVVLSIMLYIGSSTAQHVSTFSFRTCAFSIWLQLFSNFVCVPNIFKLKFLNDSTEQYLSVVLSIMLYIGSSNF